MRILVRGGIGLALVAFGYFLGTTDLLRSPEVQAQTEDQAPAASELQGLSKETQEKIKAAYEALVAAKEALVNEGKYNVVTDPAVLNTFAILSGGVDAVNDLETGRGVDPETFAALYAGLASGDIRADIEKNAQGQLTYKNKVIRMYPISRLKQEFAKRYGLAGIEGN